MENLLYKKLVTGVIKILLIAGVLVGAVLVYAIISYKNQEVNLLSGQDWSHVTGVMLQKDGIYVQPLAREIIHQDGSEAQPNPPINFEGPHLHVQGNFIMTATLLGDYKAGSFRLYSQMPIIYDQWRYEPPSVGVDFSENILSIRTWDGTSSTSMDMRTYSFIPSKNTTISLEHRDDQINIFLNNYFLGAIPDHNIFQSENIWFGMSAQEDSKGWTLHRLTAHGIGKGKVELIPPPSLTVDRSDPSTLANLANANPRKLLIGTAVSVGPLFTDKEYRTLALTEFSIITPENALKPQFIHPAPETYTFTEMDSLVDAAAKNNILIHGHTLVYDKSTPGWMNDAPKEARQKILLDHIQNVVTHYKGRVAEWDVINEPFSTDKAPYKNGGSGLEPNAWFEAMGEQYIDLAFKTAHEADPNAKLYLNDYALEHDGAHWDALLKLVTRLKQRAVPIYGIGFESHIYNDGDYFDALQLRKHMEILAKLGLAVRISEIDVTQDDAQEQINQYVLGLDICLKEPNCTSYSTWGITDKYGSTTRSDRYPLVYGTSLLWDKDMKAKAAYAALQNRLKLNY